MSEEDDPLALEETCTVSASLVTLVQWSNGGPI
jgi:hypothetical protein